MHIDMRTILFFIILLTGIANCSIPDKEIVYYDNGQVKFECNLVDGKRHGIAKGYYPSGKLRGEVRYVDGKMEGVWYDLDEKGNLSERKNYHNDKMVGWYEIFHKSGVLLERTLFDSAGHPVDFEAYNEDGTRDRDFVSPVVYSTPDEITVGNKVSFFARLGNADSTRIKKGYLLIASGVDSLRNNMPLDTIVEIESTNDLGFLYEFVPEKPGPSKIYGYLRFIDDDAKVISGPHRFVYEFEVR
jgi:hypothetical protein